MTWACEDGNKTKHKTKGQDGKEDGCSCSVIRELILLKRTLHATADNSGGKD